MRRLAFVVKVEGAGWVVFAVPRLRNTDAMWLATFIDYGGAISYARTLNGLAATYMPPPQRRKAGKP